MNAGIRIIKRAAPENGTTFPCDTLKTQHERQRDTASTVKGWITEWEERKRSQQIASFALVRRR